MFSVLEWCQQDAAAAKSLQSCSTLCDPIDGSPPGSPFPGILQSRTLEWVAISFSSAWKWKVKAKSLSRIWLLATPWTAAYQAPLSIGFSRQGYWTGVPLPSLKYHLQLRIKGNVEGSGLGTQSGRRQWKSTVFGRQMFTGASRDNGTQWRIFNGRLCWVPLCLRTSLIWQWFYGDSVLHGLRPLYTLGS